MNRRAQLVSLITLLVLVVSAALPSTAHAQDPLPPPPDGAPPAEAPASEESDSADIPAAEPPAAEEVALPEVLAEAPAGTDVVLLDESGTPLPLASTEAAEVLAGGDPMWCPGTAAPGDAGCTAPHASFADLLADLADDSEVGGGTIYVSDQYKVTDDGGADAGGIFFNWGDYSLTDLVIQGGWDFGSNTLNGTSTIGASMTFAGWGSPGTTLTLNDLEFVNGGVLNIVDSILADTQSDVILENVSVTGGNGDGAYIETTGDIEINDSTFQRNEWDGVEAYAGGDLTLNGVTSTANGESGVEAWAEGDLEVTDGKFSRNGDDGLYAGADNNVIITGVVVKDNSGFGILSGALGDMTLNDILADHNEIGGIAAGAIGNATASGVRAADNGLLGVVVGALGNASLSDVTARYNGLLGAGVVALGDASLNNVLASYNDGVGAAAAALGDVSIVDVRTKENGYVGTVALAFGDVTLEHVIANGNGYVGVAGGSLGGLPIVPLLLGGLDLGDVPYAGPTLEEIDWNETTMTPASVSFNDVTAGGNGLIGGVAASVGDVSITNSFFDENSLAGALAIGGGNIFVEDSTFNFNGSLGLGAGSLEEGNVLAYGITAIGNGGPGVVLGSGALQLVPIYPYISGIEPSLTAEVMLACSTVTGNSGPGLLALTNTIIAGNDLSGNFSEYEAVFGTITEGSADCMSAEKALSDYLARQRAAKQDASTSCADMTIQEGDVTAVAHELCGHDVGLVPPATPSELPAGATLHAQVDVTGDLPQPDGYLVLSFPLPAGTDAEGLSVLFWDGSQWVEVPGGAASGGEFEVTVKEAGTYILIQQ